MRIIFKILAAPFVLVLTLLVAVLSFLLSLSAGLLSILASVLGLLSVLMLFVEKDISTGIAGLLIAIEPLIDMGRTALNVSDGMVSALGTARITGNLRKEVYDDPRAEFVDQASGH